MTERETREITMMNLTAFLRQNDPIFMKMYNGDAPAFPKLMAVYGINLKTETIYFFKNDGTDEVCANPTHVHALSLQRHRTPR